MKIDIYTHVTTLKYKKALSRIAHFEDKHIDTTRMLYDLDFRFRFMDKYEDLVQVLTLASPAIEEVADSKNAVELATIANDELAGLVDKYPDKFVAAVAALPMNSTDAALKEIDRAINELKMRGIQLYTPINDRPLDSPELLPLYEKMAEYDLPIWIHPTRSALYPDYRTESRSKYVAHAIFGWPFETAMAMTRLVFGGILEKWPNLKFITHHCGGMVPFFDQRIAGIYEKHVVVTGQKYGLTKNPIDYFKMFYADTALYGSRPGLMCGYEFFGAEHILFGTDMPLGDSQGGEKNTRTTIESIKQMNISDLEKKKIFQDNTTALLRLER